MTHNTKYRNILAVCCLLLVTLLPGCDSLGGEMEPSSVQLQGITVEPESPVPNQEETGMRIENAVSDISRESEPEVADAALVKVTDGNTGFAFDLYRELRQQQGNLFFSPFSISLALAMTYAGARAETETQIANTMHFELPQDQLHPAFNKLDYLLTVAPQDLQTPAPDEEGFQLKIANSIWGQRGYPFLTEFLDILALNYGVGIQLVDYVKDTEAARLEINRWISDQTEERIKDLIPEGALNELTRLVLANAIYFKAPWFYQFDPERTEALPFFLLDGTEVTVPTMMQTQTFGLIRAPNYTALELPYQGGTTSMILIVPDAGEFEEFEDSLSVGIWRTIKESMEPTRVQLSMPRFEYESGFALRPVLESLGMADAFSIETADFSGMDGSLELYIHDVVHKAYVAVDEEGTEAAAATAVIMASKAMVDPPIEIRIDRPFMFLIRDLETDTVLFMGRVLDPTQ